MYQGAVGSGTQLFFYLDKFITAQNSALVKLYWVIQKSRKVRGRYSLAPLFQTLDNQWSFRDDYLYITRHISRDLYRLMFDLMLAAF